jgi:hypothetical protein
VETRTKPLTDAEDGLRVIRIIEAAQKSLEQDGVPVQLQGAYANVHSRDSESRRWHAVRS